MNTKLFSYNGFEYYRCANSDSVIFGRCRKGTRSLAVVGRFEVTAAYVCSLF